MQECAFEEGFGDFVAHSLEKWHKRFKNSNIEVDVRCDNNRLLYLMPDTHHHIHMENLLCNSWKSQTLRVPCPGIFLRERILSRITQI